MMANDTPAAIARSLSTIQRAALIAGECIGMGPAYDLGEIGLLDDMTAPPLALDARDIWSLTLSPLGLAVRAEFEREGRDG